MSKDGIENKEKILCAAVKINHNGEELIIPGFRHGDCFKLAIKINENVHISSKDQGFLTSKNRFVSRTEAYKIAIKTRQTDEYEGDRVFCGEDKILINEDLY